MIKNSRNNKSSTPSNSFWHYTLNSGHGRDSARYEVSDYDVDYLRTLIKPAPCVQEIFIDKPTFKVHLTNNPDGAMFTIAAKLKIPLQGQQYLDLVTCVINKTPEAVLALWDNLLDIHKVLYREVEQMEVASIVYRDMPRHPQRPDKLTLLACYRLPIGDMLECSLAEHGKGLIFEGNVTYNHIQFMLGDFERCLAWALL